ncbi:carbohydrate esterase family 3 protein [Phaeosphaeria sp. MPI-PUGE-AT-0046c]|nr:carbohydrate esterase family 3 protein [Phaeosphaeria sp. MPI-PUGE-AT-0046c]
MGRLTALLVLLVLQWLFPAIVVANSHNRRDVEKPLLRIMALGASITQGWNTNIPEEHQNGYRKSLRDELRHRGYPVNMVGSRANGDFKDHQHEGWPGLEIDQVAAKMLPVLTIQQPNLVLILLGTNDCNHARRDSNMEYARTAKDRMRTLINRIYSEVNTTTVILATPPAIRDSDSEFYIQTANAGYRALAEELAKAGRKIELVDMYTTWLAPEDYSDSIHFKPSGYAKIAALFADAFLRVEAKGWLSTPLLTDIPDNTGCYPDRNHFRGPVRTQQGSGNGDGDFIFSSTFEKSRDIQYVKGAPKTAPGHFHFANIVQLADEGPPRAELIRVLDPEERKVGNLPFVSYHAYMGDATFDETLKPLAVGHECLSKDVRWGDVNGDGLDDFICLGGDGIPHVSLNRAGVPPKFDFIGAIREDKTDPSHVYLADIDGDGRVDFCQVEFNGIKCWRNNGVGDTGSWENTFNNGNGNTLDFDSSLDPAGTYLVDINGDGRADWIHLQDDKLAGFRINQRGDRGDGPGLKPHWRSQPRQIQSWSNEEKITEDHILFGKVDDEAGYVFHFYRNTGGGGAHLRGDGVRYCDMYERGYDDYLWIGPDGAIELFENTQNPPHWNAHGQIFHTNRPGKFIHLGDWDGDGLCDILAVDHKSGNVDMWRNTYKQGDTKPSLEASRRVINSALCPQPVVNGDIYDLAIRFGDLDGDRRVDYICLDPNGRSSAWLNTPTGLVNLNQIKSSEGVPRSSIHFADVNGDGSADYLAINASTGTVHIWINLANAPFPPSGIAWDSQPEIWMQGVERGANVHFPKLSTSGRADCHVVYPQTSVADTWYNEGGCVGGGAGDD